MIWMCNAVWKVIQSEPYCRGIIFTLPWPRTSLATLPQIWVYLCGGNCVGVHLLPLPYPHQHMVRKHLIHIWDEAGMQFERLFSLNNIVPSGIVVTLSWPRILAQLSQTVLKFVAITVWVCIHNPIHMSRWCSNTLYMYEIDVGCSLKGHTTSTIA